MGILHTACCVALCIAPPVIYYQATPLSEYDAFKSAGHGLVSSVICNLVKLVLTAVYVPTGHGAYNAYLSGVAYLLLGLADVVCLWAAFTKFSHRVSNAHKFQAIGLGWALGDAVLRRLGPILMGAHTSEYTLEYIIQALEANVMLAQMISMAAVGAMLWSKKGKPAFLLTGMRLLLLAHVAVEAITSYMQNNGVVTGMPILMVKAVCTAALSVCSWVMWQAANAKQT